jgi:hypothetical protein
MTAFSVDYASWVVDPASVEARRSWVAPAEPRALDDFETAPFITGSLEVTVGGVTRRVGATVYRAGRFDPETYGVVFSIPSDPADEGCDAATLLFDFGLELSADFAPGDYLPEAVTDAFIDGCRLEVPVAFDPASASIAESLDPFGVAVEPRRRACRSGFATWSLGGFPLLARYLRWAD